jgi:hypothetical protein
MIGELKTPKPSWNTRVGTYSATFSELLVTDGPEPDPFELLEPLVFLVPFPGAGLLAA